MLAVDLNHGHLAAWIVLPDGNPSGPAVTVPLDLDGLPASQRDGRLRAAVSELIGIARQHGCTAIAAENLNFEHARAEGRESHGNRPSRGKRGRAFRRTVGGIPTGQFSDRIAQMCFNQGIAVIAVRCRVHLAVGSRLLGWPRCRTRTRRPPGTTPLR